MVCSCRAPHVKNKFPAKGCATREPVKQYVARKEATAISGTPSPKGVMIFFNPASACTAGTTQGAILNEATLFHEALHGFTGLDDSALSTTLGVNTDTLGSVAISYYLEQKCFGGIPPLF